MRAVITGGPSVGKTTLISLLADRGFKVVEEFATQIIKEGTVLPWVDRASFQAEVLRRQIRAESAIRNYPGAIFLDRGLFDGEAYYIYDKIEIPKAFSYLDAAHYSIAFLVEELPFFDRTAVRRENLEFAREISVILESCYRSRNVEVVRVPAMPPVERVEFVIEQFKRHCVSKHSFYVIDDLPERELSADDATIPGARALARLTRASKPDQVLTGVR